MIEEIKKELQGLLQAFDGSCYDFCPTFEYFDSKDIFEILNKYEKHIDSYSKEWLYKQNKDRLDANFKLIKEKESLLKYKTMWEELKEEFKVAGRDFSLTSMQELETEHGIGVE